MDLQVSRSFTKSDLESMLLDEAAEPRSLPFSLLEDITNAFSYKQEIGRGGFAVVYKAMLENGDVAVKRLHQPYMHEKEFQREVECLMKVKHKNIIRFLGYCSNTEGNMQKYNGKMVMAEIPERLLCFEYLPKGTLDDYIEDSSRGLEWSTRYQMIKGICEGLHSLHHTNIMHLDLKPSNILMDDNLNPKITDFGVSRILDELQTRVVPTKMFGTLGYLAPEFTSHEITPKFDLYSLGVLIMEILTGDKEVRAIENILDSWDKRMELSEGNQNWEQIKLCAEIAIECTNNDPAKRPISMKHIIDILADMESKHEKDRLAEMERLRLAEMESVELHPLKPRFYLVLSESIPSSLHLTNKTNEHVVFRLMKKSRNSLQEYSTKPLYGGVPPRSTCTLIIKTEEKKLAQETGTDLVLQGSICGAKNAMLLKNEHTCNKHFNEAKELGHAVYELALKAFYIAQLEETASEPAVRPKITKAIFLDYPELCYSMDVHPTEPWTIIGHYDGTVSVWNYENKTSMVSFKISKEPAKIQKIGSLRAPNLHGLYSVGIHPTKPYVLSESMKLWDGDKGWKCTNTFGTGGMLQLAFNPEDPSCFASAMYSGLVEVWSLDSPKPEYTLNGHSGRVRCLDFFKCGDRQYLITGSEDCTAKIWDLHKRTYIHTIEGFMSPVIFVISIPGRPYLVTCSANATIHVWSSINFRLKTTVNFSGDGVVRGLQCLMGSRRIAIGQWDKISIMDIDDYEEDVNQEGSNEGISVMGIDDEEVVAHEGSNEEISIRKMDDVEVVAHEGNDEALSILEINEEDVSYEGNNGEISGRVVAGQEKAVSIIGTGDEEEAFSNKGNNSKSTVQENPSCGKEHERWSWQKDKVTGVWTKVKISLS